MAAVLCLMACNYIFSPVWTDWNNYDTTHGFYEEPEDTIETVFLGTSNAVSGIIPIELYESYGICSYNLSTELQPMMASYYWLEEAYRFHSGTLDTVVLDVSGLRNNVDIAFYHKAIDPMHFSEVKLQAVRDYSDGWEETVQNLIPLLSYHSRWDDLGAEDLLKAGYEPELSLRGYNFVTDRRIDSVNSYSDIMQPLYETDPNVQGKKLNAEAENYFRKIAEFCEEHDLRLVLTKLPEATKWESDVHNAVQQLADSYGLDFLDLNVDPYYDEMGFNFATDCRDEYYHSNYWGASKITSYLGEYLTKECGNRDVRGEDAYSFMEDELEDYSRIIAKTSLMEFNNPCDYLSYTLEQGDYTIFLSVRNDAAKKLEDTQREFFSSIGLIQLSNLSYRDSYLAVINDDVILTEQYEVSPEEGDGDPLTFEGSLPDGTTYSVTSGGRLLGNTSSVLIDGEEYSFNKNGLNIVVYDNLRGEVIDSANFDTHSSPERQEQDYDEHLKEELDGGTSYAELSGTDRILYQYDRACENDKLLKKIHREIGDDGLISYLEIFSGMDGMEIYLSAKGETDSCLTEEVRSALKELGLEELSKIENQDSYLALISDGEVQFEERDHGEFPLEVRSTQAVLISSGSESDSVSSVVIDGEEYSMDERGINVVVYDSILETVVDTAVFDTFSVEPSLITEN